MLDFDVNLGGGGRGGGKDAGGDITGGGGLGGDGVACLVQMTEEGGEGGGGDGSVVKEGGSRGSGPLTLSRILLESPFLSIEGLGALGLRLVSISASAPPAEEGRVEAETPLVNSPDSPETFLVNSSELRP